MLTEHHLTVNRTARYVLIGGADRTIAEFWFVCHGYGQRAARFAREFEGIANESRQIVVPEALSRFYLDSQDPGVHPAPRVGASWMTREERDSEINDYVEYLSALWRQVSAAATPAARLVVLGFSQGAATAARWAVLSEATPALLVLWAGSLPRDLLTGKSLVRLRAIPLVLVAGTEDRYATDEAVTREQQALEEAGVTSRVVRFAGGHAIDTETLKSLAAA